MTDQTPPMTVPHHSEPAREAVTTAMVNAAWNEAKTRRMTGLPTDFRAVLEAALSASPAPAAGGLEAVRAQNDTKSWRPMETAPRCGTWFEARTESGYTRRVHFAASDDRLPIDHSGEMWSTLPLEWRPIVGQAPAATSAETQGGDGGRIVPTDKAEALQAIIDEMKRERKAMCEALGCVDLPGAPLKFVHEQRDRLSKAWQREVELIRSWDRASLTERQELDEMRRGWGPTTPTERMRRKADVQAAMQCLSSAMADLTLSEDEAEAADDEVNRRLDEAYQRVSKQYVATIAILNSMDDPLQLPDLDAALAPSTSAATRGEPVAWVQPGYLSMLQKCGSCSMRAEPIEAMDYVVPIYASSAAPAVESAQVKAREALFADLLAFVQEDAKSNPVFAKGHGKVRIAEARALVARASLDLATDAEG